MKKLLVVVDMQKDFVDGSLGTAQAQAIVPLVQHKIKDWKAAGGDVVFTRDTHSASYLDTAEGKKLPVEHCIRDTPGWQIIPQISGWADTVFDKPTFGSIALANYATDRAYRIIELVGLCTDICVISNAFLLKAFLPEAEIRVDASCCAGVTPESHENALAAMQMCQVTVMK